MVGVCRVEVAGPLAPFACGIEEVLLAEGYRDESVRILMRLVADVSLWLGERRLGAADLRTDVIDEFFTGGGGRRCQRVSPRSLRVIVAHLCSLGVLASSGEPKFGRHEGRGRAARGLWQVVCRPARADHDDYRPVRRASCGLPADVAS